MVLHTTAARKTRQSSNLPQFSHGRAVYDDLGLWLEKFVDPEIHMLRRPYRSWAVDRPDLELLREFDGIGVRQRVRGNSAIEATLEAFDRSGYDVHHYGFGEQRGLAVRFWKPEGTQGRQPPLFLMDDVLVKTELAVN